MGVPLYLLISGDILYCGLCLVVGGVAVSTWRPSVGRVLAWSGLVLALVSAVPIHPALYALLFLLVVGWQISRRRDPRVNQRMAAVPLGGVALVLAAALLDRADSSVVLPTNRPVFVIGDSLSAGMRASKEGTWPQLVSAKLHLNVSNLARAGATLGDGKVQAKAIPEGPATVLVELGGNDLLGGASAAKFRADLHSLLGTLATKERTVLMFELPWLPFQNSFGRIQREVCAEHAVVLLPRSLLAGAVALPGHASDGLHLSAAGHSWLAARIAEMWPRV